MEYTEDSFQGVFCMLWKASATYYSLKGIAGADPERLFFQN